MSNECPSCSHKIKSNQNFCGNCGQNLQAETSPLESRAQNNENNDIDKLDSSNKTSGNQTNSKALASTGIGCCSIFFGIGLGMVGIMLTATIILAPIGIPLLIQARGAFGIGTFGFGLAEHWSRED